MLNLDNYFNMWYIYRGDRFTDPALKNKFCFAVKRPDGKCIRGRNGSMLVRFCQGSICVVLARQLRKITPRVLNQLAREHFPEETALHEAMRRTWMQRWRKMQMARDIAEAANTIIYNLKKT
jgi:hypothetical protein